MTLIELLILLLFLSWIGGFSFHIAGGLIHVLLVIALILLVIRLIERYRQ